MLGSTHKEHFRPRGKFDWTALLRRPDTHWPRMDRLGLGTPQAGATLGILRPEFAQEFLTEFATCIYGVLRAPRTGRQSTRTVKHLR